jgi:DNA-binding CsgD family transcriptional regulator/tetratricopeptide (TPR) repeat protein
MTLEEIEHVREQTGIIDSVQPEILRIYECAAPRSIERGWGAYYLGSCYKVTKVELSEQFYREAREIAVSSQNSALNLELDFRKVLLMWNRRELSAANSAGTLLYARACELGMQFLACRCCMLLGLIALTFGSNEIGIDLMNLTLSLSIRHGYHATRLDALSRLVELSLISRDFAKAKEYALQCVEFSAKTGLNHQIAKYKVRLATTELELQDYTRVVELVEEIRSTVPLENHSLWCVTHTLLGNVQVAKRQLKKAEAEFKSAIKLADYPNSERVRSNVHVYLSELYLRMKQKPAALKEALAALKDAEKVQDALCRKDALRMIQECYKALGKYREAHRYLEKYNTLVSESDAALFKNRLEYHALKSDFEKEKVKSEEKARQAELLKIELGQKERELTEKTKHLIKQTESLVQFRDDLRSIVRRTPADDPVVNKIKNRLAELPESQVSWQEFDTQFGEVHPEFLDTLTKRFPKLTPMERKICALLRLNLNSPDIAKLLFLSERNIQNHRYRLRKKLSLSSDANIYEFLTAI